MVRRQQGLEGSDRGGAASAGLRVRAGFDCEHAAGGPPPATLIRPRLSLPGAGGAVLGSRQVAGRLEEAEAVTNNCAGLRRKLAYAAPLDLLMSLTCPKSRTRPA